MSNIFKIENGHKIFKDFAWLMEARGPVKKKCFTYREHLTRIEITIKKNTVIFAATDGRRLHTFEEDFKELKNIPGFGPGVYSIDKAGQTYYLTIDKDTKYPTWRQVIPKGEPEKIINEFINKGTWSDLSSSYYKICTQLEACLNLNYVKSLVGLTWTIKHFGGLRPIVFEALKRTAVLMPMKIY